MICRATNDEDTASLDAASVTAQRDPLKKSTRSNF